MPTNQSEEEKMTTNQNGELSANEDDGVVSTKKQENVVQQDVSNFTFNRPIGCSIFKNGFFLILLSMSVNGKIIRLYSAFLCERSGK